MGPWNGNLQVLHLRRFFTVVAISSRNCNVREADLPKSGRGLRALQDASVVVCATFLRRFWSARSPLPLSLESARVTDGFNARILTVPPISPSPRPSPPPRGRGTHAARAGAPHAPPS